MRVASGDLCGKAAKAPTEAGVETNAHWRVEGSQPHRVKGERLAQGELMLCVNSYWVLPDAEIRRFGGFAAASPLGKSTEIGGMEIETDTA